MRSFARLVVAVVLFCLPGPTAWAAEVARAAPPAWVSEVPVPQPRPARMRQVEDGVYYLLLDSQVKTGHGHDVFYSRNVYKVTDRSGLEDAARFDVDFDPSQEHVVLHQVRVIRNGVIYDRLKDADVQVLRRENGLDKGIFDGHKTVHVEIKGVEVGDIVDYAYSWVSDSSLWPGQFFGHVTTQWSVPLELMRYRILWPADRAPLTLRSRSTALKPSLSRAGDDVVYTWQETDPDPVPGEDGTPDWYPTWGEISVSSMASWSDVVAWALPLYEGRDALTPELVARLDAIAAKYPRPEDRITEAMRYVEDSVRYVSMSIGAGSYTPRTPAEVIRSGFGDCKDKSQLLAAALRHLGIEAHVSLTDMDDGPSLSQVAPSPTAFDHAIVQVRLKGKSYWLDPTGSNEGGRFPRLAALDYGWALPLAAGQARLDPVRPPKVSQPTYRTVERYDFGDDEHADLTLSVETTYLDGEADAMRADIASISAAQLESDYLKFYAGMYPGLKRLKPLQIADDRDRNRIVVREFYRLAASDLKRGKLLERFEVKASSMNSFDKIPNGTRTTPYKLAYPVDREHVIELVTPGRAPPAPKSVTLGNAGFSYAMAVDRAGDTLTLDYRMVGRKNVLASAEVADAADIADKIADDNYWYLDLTSTAGGTMGDAKSQGALATLTNLLAAIGVIALAMWSYQGWQRLRARFT
ncbi:MAG: DUF3857 domain-containing transglutaminase family protein [Proteobacteria bacterium]|nr:DUF3857 domain-containing transglutaminase family protein [Pseudomonadota bacterium]